MNKSLKGCPFCGRTPKVLHRTDSLDGYFCAISCFCGGCSARAHQAATGADESEAYMKAALRWNRRPEPENKPLTLEELRGMVNKPIYIKHLFGEWKWNGWHILKSWENELTMHGNSISLDDNYGKTWVAYDRPPKEGVL